MCDIKSKVKIRFTKEEYVTLTDVNKSTNQQIKSTNL